MFDVNEDRRVVRPCSGDESDDNGSQYERRGKCKEDAAVVAELLDGGGKRFHDREGLFVVSTYTEYHVLKN